MTFTSQPAKAGIMHRAGQIRAKDIHDSVQNILQHQYIFQDAAKRIAQDIKKYRPTEIFQTALEEIVKAPADINVTRFEKNQFDYASTSFIIWAKIS